MDRFIYLSIKEILNNNGSFQDFTTCLENPTSIGLIGAHLELSSSGIMNRILPLTTSIAGSCFNVTKSTINYDVLLNNNVIVDLSPFEDLENNAARKIFTNVLYYYMLHYYF